MYFKCCIPHCNSKRKDCRLHKLPLDVHQRNKWLDIINCDKLKSLDPDKLDKLLVCHKHFEKRFHTTKLAIKLTGYPTLFSSEEIETGISLKSYDDKENKPLDHNYAGKCHYDHTYCKSLGKLELQLAVSASLEHPHSLAGNNIINTLQEKFPLNCVLLAHTFANIGRNLETGGRIRCRLWIKATGNEDLVYLPIIKLNENKFICGNHFARDFINDKGNRLKKGAVPTINFLNPPLSEEVLAQFPLRNDSCQVKIDSSLCAINFKNKYPNEIKLRVGQSHANKNRTHARDKVASSIDDEPHANKQVNDDHADVVDNSDPLDIIPDSPSEPVLSEFSWQMTGLIDVDEQHTESKNLLKPQSDAVRDVSNDTVIVGDDVTTEVPTSNTEYCCDGCREYITGYTCVQCDDYDLCGACEANMIHPQHYMLRVPGPRPQKEVKQIIEAIRRKLEILGAELRNDGIACMDWLVEIKKEEDPLEEEMAKTIEHDLKDANLEDPSDHYEVPDVSHYEVIDDNVEQMEDDTEHYEPEYLDIYQSESKDDEQNNMLPSSPKRSHSKKQISGLQSKEVLRSSSVLNRKKMSNKPKTRESFNQKATNIHSGDLETVNTRLTHSNKEIPVHPAKRKTNDCLDKEFFDMKQTTKLPKMNATFKTIDETGNNQASHSQRMPVHPAKRKTSVCLNENFLNDEGQSTELSKITVTSEPMGNTIVNLDNIETGKIVQLSRKDAEPIEGSTILLILDSDDRQIASLTDNSQKRIILIKDQS